MKRSFIETIGAFDGKLPQLNFHQSRLNRTQLAHFGYAKENVINLSELLSQHTIPTAPIVKIRVLYDRAIQSVTVEPYDYKEIYQFFLRSANGIDYRFKYADRTFFDEAKAALDKDSEVIFVRDNEITDTSIHNILFFDNGRWVTPEHPLLNGVERAQLLSLGTIQKKQITLSDVKKGRYSKFRLVNALTPFEAARDFPLSAIVEE